ncbi:MAG: bifunctional hydroxymethylpyrimidine kinase/phosphomethylpyrimidine kinase [Candidatus Schekmanbacteria bacterium]|nr:bifunctional hydroxymethylpyrimidine kinase/phosphomethylpyrimidine kinase [Candidatus Schekmanbacteria bacterium]
MFKVLTIAGSDSGGGAGVQADLRVVNSMGGYGATVITAITAQNTLGIESIFSLPADIVENQLDAVLRDIKFDAVKTGMLYTSALINVTAARLKHYKVRNLVVDPVTVSKGGNILLKKEAIKSLVEKIFPLSILVTPNIDEATVLSGINIKNIDDMKSAAKVIVKLGAKNVLVKGGHLKGAPVDVFYNGRAFTLFEGKRIESKNTHGIGCMFSAFIASLLACGFDLKSAVSKAKEYVENALINSEGVGNGISPPDPSSWVVRDAVKLSAIEDAQNAFEILKGRQLGFLIPEVQTNIASVTVRGNTIDDVAAFPGRIVRLGDDIAVLSSPKMGASSHIARVLLTARSFDKSIAGSMNIKYSPSIVSAAKKLGLEVAEFSRKSEPKSNSSKEGRTLDWGVEQILRKKGKCPDIIFDKGGEGKEPMIRVFGRSAKEAAEKVLKIAFEMKKTYPEGKAKGGNK